MDSDNLRKFMSSSCNHIANLNHALKGIKSNTIIDFICIDYKGLIITSNKVTFLRTNTSLLSSYHHLVWLALIGNSSELSSFSTLSKLIMKSKSTTGMKTPAEVKHLVSFFMKPRLQVPRNELSIDWSEDTPEVQSLPTPHVSPTGENVSSPCALLHNRDAKGKRRTDLIDSGPLLLNYGRNQPSIPSFWDGAHHALSIFRTDETSEIDAINMAQSISRIIDYIKNNPIDKKSPAREFEQVTKGFWNLISAIYFSRWDLLPVKDSKNFCALVGEKILNNYVKLGLVN